MKTYNEKVPVSNEVLHTRYSNCAFKGVNFIDISAKIFDSEIENCDIRQDVEIVSSKLANCQIADGSKIGNYRKSEQASSEIQNNKAKYFGTDGIRGVWNQGFFNANLIKKIAKSLCYKKSPLIVLGTDTRPSGKEISSIFIEEATKFGAKILNYGIISTPAVSFFTAENKADYGVVITASHNPIEFNGIKILDGNGVKLPETNELELENLFDKVIKEENITSGKVINKNKSFSKYINFLQQVDENKFDGIKIVLDCANGAVSKSAPELFANLHADVIAINTEGEINKNCGAVYPEKLSKEVLKHKADIGFSFDGDADRVVMVNSKGQILDGDEILYLLAWYYKSQNLLKSNKVVGTIMTNYGIENKLRALGLDLVRTPVGDKFIADEMEHHNYELGGEQSGHIIIKKYFLSGDGLLTAIILASVFLENKHIFNTVKENKYIQISKNIILNKKFNNNLLKTEEFNNLINFYTQKLKHPSRILIRPSGTEPKLRITVETTDKTTASIFAIDLKRKLTKLIKQIKDN